SLLERSDGLVFAFVNIKDAVQASDLEDLHDIIGDVAELQLDVGRFALVVEQDEFADHGRGHERNTAKVQHDLAGGRLGDSLHQFRTDLLDGCLIKDFGLGELD